MDFVTDALADGRQFRCFTIVDDMTRECPAIEVDHSCDNGPEFAGRVLDLWAHARGVALQFIRPGKPVENAFIESFNGKFRNECLDTEWFNSITEAQQTVERWRVDYNEIRPHGSLNRRTPAEFAMELKRNDNSPQRLTA